MSDFNDLTQVIKFIAELDQNSADQLSAQLRELTNQRVVDVAAAEEKITGIHEQAAAKKIDLAARELNALEEAMVSSTERELAQIQRMTEANEERYKVQIAKANEAIQAQTAITTALYGEDLQKYETALRTKDALSKRQKDVELEREREGSIFGRALGRVGGVGGAMRGLGGAAGFLAGKMPADTEQEKTNKLVAETTGAVLKSKTPLEALVNIGKATLNYWDLKLKEDARRSEAMISAMGGTKLWGDGGQAHKQLKGVMKQLEESRVVLKKQLPNVEKMMASILQSRPEGGLVTQGFNDSVEKMGKTFMELRVRADTLGRPWPELAKTIGDLSRKEMITFRQGLSNLDQTFMAAKNVSKSLELEGGISIKGFIDNVIKGQDMLRPFGFTMQDTTRLVARFGKELDRGILSMQDLVDWSTGLTRTDDASRSFLFQQMMSTIGSDPRFGQLQAAAARVTADPRSQSRFMEAMQQKDIRALSELGLNKTQAEEAIAEFNERGGFQETLVTLAKRTAGPGATQFDIKANIDFVMREIVNKLIGVSPTGTIEKREAIRAAGFGSDAMQKFTDLVPPAAEATQSLTKGFIELNKIVEETRSFMKGISSAWDRMKPGEYDPKEVQEAWLRNLPTIEEARTINRQFPFGGGFGGTELEQRGRAMQSPFYVPRSLSVDVSLESQLDDVSIQESLKNAIADAISGVLGGQPNQHQRKIDTQGRAMNQSVPANPPVGQ